MNKLLVLTVAILLTGFNCQAQRNFSFQDLQKWWKGNSTTGLTTTDPVKEVPVIKVDTPKVTPTNPVKETPSIKTRKVTANSTTILTVGQEMSSDDNAKIYSPNKAFFVLVQEDGHLVTYTSANAATWGSGTNGQGIVKLILQTDGHLVIYNSRNQAIWASKTYGGKYSEAKYKPTKLVLGNDGKLSLYSASNIKVWTNKDGLLPLN
jgi:hypothetical protein